MQATITSYSSYDSSALAIIDSDNFQVIVPESMRSTLHENDVVALSEDKQIILVIIHSANPEVSYDETRVYDTLKVMFKRLLVSFGDNKIVLADLLNGGGVSALLGSLKIDTDGITFFKISLFNNFNIDITPEKLEVSYISDSENFGITIQDGEIKTFKPKEKQKQKVYEFTSEKLSIVANKLSVAATELKASFGGSINVHTQAYTESIDTTKKTTAANMKNIVGGIAGGLWEVRNGLTAGIKSNAMTASNSITAPLGININGAGEFGVNGIMNASVLTALIASIVTLATAVPLGPLGAPQAAAAASTASAVLPVVGLSVNPFIRQGLVPIPFI